MIDSDGSLKKNVEKILKIINSPNFYNLNEGSKNAELNRVREVLKIDLILLKSSQPFKDYKYWEKEISHFEKKLDKLMCAYL